MMMRLLMMNRWEVYKAEARRDANKVRLPALPLPGVGGLVPALTAPALADVGEADAVVGRRVVAMGGVVLVLVVAEGEGVAVDVARRAARVAGPGAEAGAELGRLLSARLLVFVAAAAAAAAGLAVGRRAETRAGAGPFVVLFAEPEAPETVAEDEVEASGLKAEAMEVAPTVWVRGAVIVSPSLSELEPELELELDVRISLCWPLLRLEPD